MSNLVIVESPTKARTLSRYLGKDYRIEASMGHIRDLPKGALGVEVENNFEPDYIIPRDKKKRVNELKKTAQEAETLILATDPDREGEAIAWHLKHIITDGKGKKPKDIRRVVFHEITESAIKKAFEHPRELNIPLVDAQQARRVLDRLVGYKLSPLLWKKIKRGLSAGRVQSAALRLIVEREEEIKSFKPQEYWSIEAELECRVKNSESKIEESKIFLAALVEINGKKAEIKNEAESHEHVQFLQNANFSIDKVTKKEVKRTPAPPFTTSTLQQAAGNKLGMTAKRTMMIAQNLYEQGFITYMRTDSVNLSPESVIAARDFIENSFGKVYLPEGSRVYTSKSKNAQEAHEAIRPTNMKLTPDKLDGDGFTRDHRRLYELIWKRMIASQIADAVFDQTSIDVKAIHQSSAISYLLRASGSVLKFDGWMRVYGVSHELSTKDQENKDEAEVDGEGQDSKNQILPEGLMEGQKASLNQLFPKQHFTQPPPRFTEASLIKKLEELGIGRPSTYAPILSTIQDRYYVERQERKFIPTELGFAVMNFLMQHFPDVFDYAFTASMEDQLDEISRGEREWRQTIGSFYNPFEKKLEKTLETAEKVQLTVEEVDKDCPKCGKKLVVRMGKFGKFLACSGFPDCKHTETIEEKVDVNCPDCGGEVVIRKTRRGKSFFGCKNWPNCKFASWTKPK